MAGRRKKKNTVPTVQAPTVYDGTNYDQKSFSDYLTLYPVNTIRFHACILVLFMLNLFVIIPVLGNPFQPVYAYILLPPLIAMNIWAVALILLPRRLQLNYVLFRGVFGVIATLSFMIANQKFAYGMLGLQSPWYFILSFAAYFIGFCFYAKSHIRKLKQQPLKALKEQNAWKDKKGAFPVITGLAGCGYLAANISLAVATQQMVAVVLMSVYTMLTFILFHFIIELHRYYWLRKTAPRPAAV